ncbi:MAG: hypothetical protein C5B51_04550 [Terriglobia bacterium]|nr:MAG: hypothetical protein C5B51_04550 [Terriglobia bacterium]
MSSITTLLGGAVWELPPLILYPFNERVAPSTLLESSKAALVLSGMMPGDGADPDELRRRLLAGRYAEIRMLYFLGKDVMRWVEQCQEFVEHTPELRGIEIRGQSFSGLLTANPPEAVKSKLVTWGVTDYSSIFARGVGLNMMFSGPPPFNILSAEFLGSYHRYSDSLFRCYMELQSHRVITPGNFRFDLYASGEYTRLLEAQWGGS